MLIFAFLLASVALILQTILFPNFVILAFAPWIALVVISRPMPKCLFLAMLGGVFLDILSDDPLGVHALNYTVIAFIFYRYRRYFSYDQPVHLSMFTLLISFCSTLLQLFLLFLFDRRIPFTGEWAFGDLCIMPVADAIYALLWFAYPLRLYAQGSVFCLNIKKKLFQV